MVMQPQNWVLLAYTLASVALVVILVIALGRGRRIGVYDAVLPLLVTLGLAYDNALLTFGASWGESAALEVASYPRYLMHAVFTPLLVVFAALTAHRWDVPGFRQRPSIVAWSAVTGLIVALGLFGEIGMHLTPVTQDGVLSYKHLDGAPPFAEIATIGALIVIGVQVARHARWSWILLGSAQMFVVAAAAASNAIVTNLGEILLLAAMASTARETVRRATMTGGGPRADAAPSGAVRAAG